MRRKTGLPALLSLGLLALGLASVGCTDAQYRQPMRRPLYAPMAWQWSAMPPQPMPVNLPTEKEKVTMPDYVLEVPDVVNIDVLRAIPKGPYHLQPTDTLTVNCPQALREEPISGVFQIAADGRVKLGLNYGSVLVADLTVEQAEEAIRKHLGTVVPKPKVTAALNTEGGVQQIGGPHIIYPDGTVRLGKYGSVYVCGMTLDQAKAAVEQHLAAHLVRPEVAISLAAINSKFYYVITETGMGEQIFRYPATGNETVLDAVAMVSATMGPAPLRRVWVARPAPPSSGLPDQVLPVDWAGVTRAGNTRTNYQILPGDRVYVAGPMLGPPMPMDR